MELASCRLVRVGVIMDRKKLKQRVLDILNQMYEEADPPMDFQHAWEHPEEYEEGWYLEHVLSEERQLEIIKSKTKWMRAFDKRMVDMAILNWSPKHERGE